MIEFVCEGILPYFFIGTNQRDFFMRAIIPVAGVGSRLRPYTFTVPKVLLNVAGKPIIGHILDKIIESGFT
jgi:UTP-glucose-1-phosphate uridylyltransferase